MIFQDLHFSSPTTTVSVKTHPVLLLFLLLQLWGSKNFIHLKIHFPVLHSPNTTEIALIALLFWSPLAAQALLYFNLEVHLFSETVTTSCSDRKSFYFLLCTKLAINKAEIWHFQFACSTFLPAPPDLEQVGAEPDRCEDVVHLGRETRV